MSVTDDTVGVVLALGTSDVFVVKYKSKTEVFPCGVHDIVASVEVKDETTKSRGVGQVGRVSVILSFMFAKYAERLPVLVPG